jgi:hypothetical protein
MQLVLARQIPENGGTIDEQSEERAIAVGSRDAPSFRSDVLA